MSGASSQGALEGIFELLTSADLTAVEECKKLIRESLSSGRDSWLVDSLVETYLHSQSSQVADLLAELRDPHIKTLLERLREGVKTTEKKLPSLRLLFHLMCRQPPWLLRVVDVGLLAAVLKTLKVDIDIPLVATGLMSITVLLPVAPVPIVPFLPDIFDVFFRMASFCVKKPPNVDDTFLLHLRVALYSLLHRLYGMFPCSFLAALQDRAHRRDNTLVFQEVIGPMLDRVRFHPLLVSGSRDSETAASRWKHLETQDIVVDCAKLSLDLIEGTWEETRCPIISPCFSAAQSFLRAQLQELGGRPLLAVAPGQSLAVDKSGLLPPQELWLTTAIPPCPQYSPSLLVGLSTPPSSPRSTPALSLHDSQPPPSLAGTMGNTPLMLSRETTPRQTPTFDSPEQVRGGRARPVDLKRLSAGSSLGPRQSSQEQRGTASVPVSPLRPEFTAEPPRGLLPTRGTARTLQLEGGEGRGAPRFVETGRPGERMQGGDRMVEVAKAGVGSSFKTADSNVGREEAVAMTTRAAGPMTVERLAGVLSRVDQTEAEAADAEVSTLTNPTLTLLPLTASLDVSSDDKDDDSRDDEEELAGLVSEEARRATAESVKQFMQKVNRIRFNSLTHSAEPPSPALHPSSSTSSCLSRLSRSSSCPRLPQCLTQEREESQLSCLAHSLSVREDDTPKPSMERVLRDLVRDNRHEQSPGLSVGVCEQLPRIDSATQVSPSLERVPWWEIGGGDSQLQDIFRLLTAPVPLSFCRRCHHQLLLPPDSQAASPTPLSPGLAPSKPPSPPQPLSLPITEPGVEIPLFTTYSPSELLDRHLELGTRLQAKELSRLPLTAGVAVHWSHFGTGPPADEVNILKGQTLLLHNQVMFERHKRELHAKRNRRLLRKIAHVKSLEEQNAAMIKQQDAYCEEIRNLQVSMKLLQDENNKLRSQEESNQLEKLVKLRTTLQQNADLKAANTELKALLVQQRKDFEELEVKLERHERELFHARTKLNRAKDKVGKAQGLKNKVFELQKQVLWLGELHRLHQEKHQRSLGSGGQRILDRDSRLYVEAENEGLKQEVEEVKATLAAAKSKVTELTEQLKKKEADLALVKGEFEQVKKSSTMDVQVVRGRQQTLAAIDQHLEGQLLRQASLIQQLQQTLQWRRRSPGREARGAGVLPEPTLGEGEVLGLSSRQLLPPGPPLPPPGLPSGAEGSPEPEGRERLGPPAVARRGEGQEEAASAAGSPVESSDTCTASTTSEDSRPGLRSLSSSTQDSRPGLRSLSSSTQDSGYKC